MAAHISAASSGKSSRRYDASLSAKVRASAGNGIWCCYTHGKLIDTDETTYTTEMLTKWKELAEKRASLLQMSTNRLADLEEYRRIGMAPVKLHLDGTHLNKLIPKALQESCSNIVFGENINRYLCDFLIEYSKNAYAHGRASTIEIQFGGQAIKIRDNGAPFDARQLLTSDDSRGGAHSFQLLMRALRVDAIHSTTEIGWSNCLQIPIAYTVEQLRCSSNCVVSLDLINRTAPTVSADVVEKCNRVFIVFDGHLVVSDITDVNAIIKNLGLNGKEVVLVLPDAAPEKISRYEERCGVEVISLPVR